MHDVVVFFVVIVFDPILRCISIGFTVLLQLTELNQLLFTAGMWSFLPFTGVSLTIHYNSLGLGNNTVIAGSDFGGCHLRNSYCNGFSLCGHNDDLGSDIDVVIITKDTGNHQFCSIANSVDWRIFDNDSWEFDEQDLKRENSSSKISFIFIVFVSPLGIEDIMHGN